mmetsp:Transcript_45983/g.62540  ORF Transcript_45983/g.62540 Transcript_45983/m.62540 type:complete len:233 (-) Transcript_45983:359-1057(-)|eukprot:CAMPEP_0185777308 /NCGR_PEP_ID=MMETSP1174-20130828/88977_1 /TAXON_ID=35687 /ORGANISM="Dictyocha speculum, Strain CCMP1381" /LENGTH=232 /DNA_ID=CAMNT_0028465625 /DNA_START=13 /DNA_END=711 /DNA_ORIENTATION=-
MSTHQLFRLVLFLLPWNALTFVFPRQRIHQRNCRIFNLPDVDERSGPSLNTDQPPLNAKQLKKEANISNAECAPHRQFLGRAVLTDIEISDLDDCLVTDGCDVITALSPFDAVKSSHHDLVTMDTTRVVVTVSYSCGIGLRKFYEATARKVMENHPDVFIRKKLILERQNGNLPFFQIDVDGKSVYTKRPEARGIFLNMVSIKSAIKIASIRRRKASELRPRLRPSLDAIQQ